MCDTYIVSLLQVNRSTTRRYIFFRFSCLLRFVILFLYLAFAFYGLMFSVVILVLLSLLISPLFDNVAVFVFSIWMLFNHAPLCPVLYVLLLSFSLCRYVL